MEEDTLVVALWNYTLLLFLHEHDDRFSHVICAQLLLRVNNARQSHSSTSSAGSMEYVGVRNAATGRASLLSVSDQVQYVNAIPSSIAAGPAVVMVLSRELGGTVTGLLRRLCGSAILPGQRVPSLNNTPAHVSPCGRSHKARRQSAATGMIYGFGVFVSHHVGREPWLCHLWCPRVVRCTTGLLRQQLGDCR